MITPMQVYWITRLDSACGLFVMIIVLLSSIELFLLIHCFAEDTLKENMRKLIFIGIVDFSVLVFGLFIPTTKEMATIIMLPKIANSEFAQGVPSDALELKKMAMEYLRETLATKKGE